MLSLLSLRNRCFKWAQAGVILACAAIGLSLLARVTLAQKTSIHSVDFLNFSYPSDCWRWYPNSGFEKVIYVSRGEWKKGADINEVYFAARKPIYGNLTGDGDDQAVVPAACGATAGNGWFDEVFIFGMAGEKPKLLGKLTSSDWEQHAWGMAWRVDKIAIESERLAITYFAGGSHAQPEWVATVKFIWNGTRFVKSGVSRRPFKP